MPLTSSQTLCGLAVFAVPVEPAQDRQEAEGSRHLGHIRDDPAVGPEIRPRIRYPPCAPSSIFCVGRRAHQPDAGKTQNHHGPKRRLRHLCCRNRSNRAELARSPSKIVKVGLTTDQIEIARSVGDDSTERCAVQRGRRKYVHSQSLKRFRSVTISPREYRVGFKQYSPRNASIATFALNSAE